MRAQRTQQEILADMERRRRLLAIAVYVGMFAVGLALFVPDVLRWIDRREQEPPPSVPYNRRGTWRPVCGADIAEEETEVVIGYEYYVYNDGGTITTNALPLYGESTNGTDGVIEMWHYIGGVR